MIFPDHWTDSISASQRLCGVVIGIVTNNQDPDNLGRIKVKFPWLSNQDESPWARIASPMAGKNRGLYFLPEVEDEVLVAFEQGDLRFPYILGALWNGQDTPPLNNSGGKNHVRIIQSRSGHTVRLNDEDGQETIEITDKSGKNQLKIDTASNTITLSSEQDLILRANKGNIKLEAGQGVEITSKGSMSLKGQTINLN